MSQFGHDSQDTIIYGPVLSRRYGRTLGLNLFPRIAKLCNWNCVYCQLDWTPPSMTGYADDPALIASPEELRTALLEVDEETLKSVGTLMVCGNGEPTLHPSFEACVDEILEFRSTRAPSLRVSVLTNGSRLSRPKVFAALARVDQVAVKLDAADDLTLKRVNGPREKTDLLEIGGLVRQLPNSIIQSCFIEGAVSNVKTECVDVWIEALRFIQPRRVEIYTVSRPTPTQKIHAVAQPTLEAICERARREANLEVEVFA